MMIYHMLQASAPGSDSDEPIGGKLIITVLRPETGSPDTAVTVYDAATLAVKQRLIISGLNFVSVSPDGAYMFAHFQASPGVLRVYMYDGSVYKLKSETDLAVNGYPGTGSYGSFSGDGSRYFMVAQAYANSTYHREVRMYSVKSKPILLGAQSTGNLASTSFSWPACNYDGTVGVVAWSTSVGLRKYTFTNNTWTTSTPPNSPIVTANLYGTSLGWNNDYSKFMYSPYSSADIRLYNETLTAATVPANTRGPGRIPHAVRHPATNGWVVARDITTANNGLCFITPSGAITWATAANGIADLAIDPMDNTKLLTISLDGLLCRNDLGDTSISNTVTLASGLNVLATSSSTAHFQRLYTTNG